MMRPCRAAAADQAYRSIANSEEHMHVSAGYCLVARWR